LFDNQLLISAGTRIQTEAVLPTIWKSVYRMACCWSSGFRARWNFLQKCVLVDVSVQNCKM